MITISVDVVTVECLGSLGPGGFKAFLTDSLGSLELCLTLFDVHKIIPLVPPHVCHDNKCL